MYPGTYEQFLWSKAHRNEGGAPATSGRRPAVPATPAPRPAGSSHRTAVPRASAGAAPAADARKQDRAAARRDQRAVLDRTRRIADLEARIAEREQLMKALEAQMADTHFYAQRAAADEVIARHQQLMWEVGDLMNQWETLQTG